MYIWTFLFNENSKNSKKEKRFDLKKHSSSITIYKEVSECLVKVNNWSHAANLYRHKKKALLRPVMSHQFKQALKGSVDI